MSSKIWHVNSGDYYLQDITSTKDALEVGVYELRMSIMGMYLHKITDKFEFNFKMYGLQTSFINKVIKTYENTTGNLGILFNGTKGTGKSITAEVIANELDMPVILITKQLPGINGFITSIQQDLVIFIDEFEKVFKGKLEYDENKDEEKVTGDSSLLSLMDGVMKTEFRRTFLLTTNEKWINENMLNRPGRVRYVKEFGDLSREQIEEIMDDCLENEEWREAILDFMKPLKIITVDIVKNIISEVNIFDENPAECCKDFNVEFKSDTYNVMKVIEGAEDQILVEDVNLSYVANFLMKAKQSIKTASLSTGNVYYRGVATLDNGVYTVYDLNSGVSSDTFNIRFDKVKARHSVFAY